MHAWLITSGDYRKPNSVFHHGGHIKGDFNSGSDMEIIQRGGASYIEALNQSSIQQHKSVSIISRLKFPSLIRFLHPQTFI